MNGTFSQIGGVRVGEGMFLAFNASWPLAKLAISDSEVKLSCLGKRWLLPKKSIRRLSKHQGMFSAGLRIEHDVKDYDPFIVFWTFRYSKLRHELKGMGYAVD
jgi:hypothetical protein